MAITLNGTTGITLPNGSASAPAATGTDTDTGIVYGTNTVSLATGGTTAVTVDSSQNVGIGTSSPVSFGGGYKTLEVKGSTTTNGGVVRASTSDNSYMIDMYANNAGGNLESRGANPMLFLTNATERMRIDSSGNLLAGGRTSVSGTSQAGVQILNGGVNRAEWFTDAGNYSIIFYAKNGGLNGGIVTNAGSVTYATSSDYRLKENIAPMTDALAKVSALKPVTYTWKSTGEASQGFIAHELQEVCPEAVTGEKDAVNEDGSIKPQGIDTSFLVATLTAALQEQQAIITDLKARIETLEAK